MSQSDRLAGAFAWIEKHGPELREQSLAKSREALRRYREARFGKDPTYKRLLGMRRRFGSMLLKKHRVTGERKRRETQTCFKLCGCSWQEMRDHIQAQFQEGMTWENHGNGRDNWVLDHIKPICLFDWWTWKGIQEAFHWSNVQPLWYKQHRAKSDDDNRRARVRAMEDPDYASKLLGPRLTDHGSA